MRDPGGGAAVVEPQGRHGPEAEAWPTELHPPPRELPTPWLDRHRRIPDVDVPQAVVTVRAVGIKVRERVRIGGVEVDLG